PRHVDAHRDRPRPGHHPTRADPRRPEPEPHPDDPRQPPRPGGHMSTPIDTILDPDATLDYAWDWTGWLDDEETITSYEVLAEAVTVQSHARDGNVITAWLTGAERGARATCRVTTSAG